MPRNPATIRLHHRDIRRATEHMQLGAYGAYMRLFLYSCDNDGLVPLGDEELRTLCGMTRGEWRKVQTQVLAFFVRTDEGYLHCPVESSL